METDDEYQRGFDDGQTNGLQVAYKIVYNLKDSVFTHERKNVLAHVLSLLDKEIDTAAAGDNRKRIIL